MAIDKKSAAHAVSTSTGGKADQSLEKALSATSVTEAGRDVKAPGKDGNMEPIVIDAIYSAANGFISPALSGLIEPDNSAYSVEVGELEELLDSLTMDSDTHEQILDRAINIFADGEDVGFRNGFRLAARLFLECGLGARKAVKNPAICVAGSRQQAVLKCHKAPRQSGTERKKNKWKL